MPITQRILVLANVTAASDELCAKLTERAGRAPSAFTLVVPASRASDARAVAEATVARAVQRLRDAGLEVDGLVGDCEPIVAVSEQWDPRRYDEIIVSTLPIGSSKLLRAGLPERIFKLTGALVTHIVCAPPRPPVAKAPSPRRESSDLGPLAVLGWGGHH
jgi:hypothetical protein